MSTPASTSSPSSLPVIEVDIEKPAHGGHCVARHEGRVVFVRHALPGETVRAQLTAAREKDSSWRADAIEILTPSADRVPSVWPLAGPGGVGGAELGHVALPAQLEWKTQVLAEQFARLAGREVDTSVQRVGADAQRGGLEYRTRIELVGHRSGKPGMHVHRSRKVVPVDDMPLAVEQIRESGLFGRRYPRGARIEVIAGGPQGRPLVFVDGQPWRAGSADTRPSARRTVTEQVECHVLDEARTYTYKVAAQGFWQVHRDAATVLAQAVADGIASHAPGGGRGACIMDLYSGAGLFTAVLADIAGDSGQVVAVEQDQRAVRDARRALADNPVVTLLTGDTQEILAGEQGPQMADVVVLDPPRAGAGRAVVEQICARAPQLVVYVACDPAALARDTATLAEHGYDLADLRAWDIFPHTHHFESMACFVNSR